VSVQAKWGLAWWLVRSEPGWVQHPAMRGRESARAQARWERVWVQAKWEPEWARGRSTQGRAWGRGMWERASAVDQEA
jgi:hypothetical protein